MSKVLLDAEGVQREGTANTIRAMPRRRPITDMYLAAVEAALEVPGQWVEVPRDSERSSTLRSPVDASPTGTCESHPVEGDLPIVVHGKQSIVVHGKQYIKTAAPVESRHEKVDDVWRLSIRFRP
jgi:hypothetical protein